MSDAESALLALANDLIGEIGDAKAVLRIAELEQRGVVALAGPGADPGPPAAPVPPPRGRLISEGAYMGHTIAGGAYHPSVGHQLRQQQAAAAAQQGPVHVRSYRRTEEGRAEQVGEYARQGRPASNLGHRWVEGQPGHFVEGISGPQWQAGQELWTGRGRAAQERRATPERAVAAFAARAGAVVPALLGGGHQDWDGTVKLFAAADKPSIAAALDWNGDMEFQAELAAKLRDELPGAGRINDPQPYEDVLHELIHGTMPEGQHHADQARAYADPANAAIEEGFTEYGAIEHAAAFFASMGIGDRETPVLASEGTGIAAHVPENPKYAKVRDDLTADLRTEWRSLVNDGRAPQRSAAERVNDAIYGLEYGDFSSAAQAIWAVQHLGEHDRYEEAMVMQAKLDKLKALPASRHLTMAEYAGRLADPARVAKGEAWGHYGWQTAAAQTWAQAAARAEGQGPASPRVRELADEVNREGVAGKVPAMARQVMRAAGAADQETDVGRLSELIADTIRRRWALGPATAQEAQAWDAALQIAKTLGPVPEHTEQDRTSGLMHAGDWQGGYQAIAQAPVGILGSERSRYVKLDGQEHLIDGAWSDPWWMARPGGGWAVSRRWKSAEQKRGDYRDGKYVTVTIPAKDERVLTPWTGATEAQARARETGAAA